MGGLSVGQVILTKQTNTTNEEEEMMKSKEDLLKEALDKFMYTIGAVCPNGREKSVAITNAETAYLWAKESLSKTERK